MGKGWFPKGEIWAWEGVNDHSEAPAQWGSRRSECTENLLCFTFWRKVHQAPCRVAWAEDLRAGPVNVTQNLQMTPAPEALFPNSQASQQGSLAFLRSMLDWDTE